MDPLKLWKQREPPEPVIMETSARMSVAMSMSAGDTAAEDSAAKSALDFPRVKVGVPNTDFKHHINQYILSTWQDDWNGVVTNKLHSVKPVLGDWQSSYRQCRKDEVALCHARISHTHLTHSYILWKDPPPQCEHCQCILTV